MKRIIFILMCLLCINFAYSINITNLARYFDLDSDCVDSTGLENCAPVTIGAGCIWDTDAGDFKLGTASIFCDGGNDHYLDSNYGNGDIDIALDSFSLSFWIKFGSGNIAHDAIFGAQTTGGVNNNGLKMYYLTTSNDNYGYFQGSSLVGGEQIGFYDSTPFLPFSTTDFVHVVTVYNKTPNGNGVFIYINGTLDDSITYFNDGTVLTETLAIDIPFFARYLGSTSSYESELKAWIDEIAIFNDSLSASEVFALYNYGKGVSYPLVTEFQNNVYVNNNTVNFTSDGGQICGFDGSDYSECGPTNDNTSTFKFTMNGSVDFVALTNLSINYTTLINTTYDGEYVNCTLSKALWSCTSFNLSTGLHRMYISAKAGDFEMNTFVDANVFDISIQDRNITIYEDGLDDERKYELGTTSQIEIGSNIYGELICIDIDYPGYGVNYTCTEFYNNLSVNYTQQDISFNEFSNGNTSKNVSKDTLFNITGYKYPLRSFEFQMHGLNVSNYSTDIFIDALNDGIIDAIYPNTLNDTVMQLRNFVGYSSQENLTYSQADVFVRLFNFSTNNIINAYQNESAATIGNLSIQLSGYQEEVNPFSFKERLFNESYINSSYLKNNFTYYYDDYVTGGKSNAWGGDYDILDGNYSWKSRSAAGTAGSGTCCAYTFYSDPGSFYTQNLNIEDHNKMKVRIRISTIILRYGDNCQCTASCGSYGSTGIRDKTTETNTPFGVADGDTYSKYVTIKVEGGYIKWYEDDVYKNQMSYDPSHQYEIYVSLTPQRTIAGNVYVDLSCAATGYIYPINISGLTGEYLGDNQYGNSNYFVSTLIYNSSTNILRAKITTYKQNENGGTEFIYLSNDNATTWEAASSGNFHVFTSIGKNLWVWANVTVSDADNPLVIEGYDLTLGEGTASNPKVDVGCDGIIEYNQSGIINETNSPQYVNVSGQVFKDYIVDNCLDLTCEVPVCISSDSAGIISYGNVSINQNINKTVFDADIISSFLSGENKNITFNISYTYGVIKIDGIDTRYYGDKATNITAHTENISVSKLVYWYYSNFNKTIPYTWTDDVFFTPKKENSKNVSAYGQTTTTPIYNITWLNYEDSANLSLTTNEEYACFDVYVNETYNKSEFPINKTRSNIVINKSYGNETSIFLFADFSWEGGYVSKRNLILYYQFEGNANDTRDNYNGEVFGAIEIPGQVKNALNFSGSDFVNTTYQYLGTSRTMWIKNTTESNWAFLVNSSGTMYENGIASNRTMPISNTTGYTLIGLGFEGGIDEVTMWNRRLTSTEIVNIYNNSRIGCEFPPAYVYADFNLTACCSECVGCP